MLIFPQFLLLSYVGAPSSSAAKAQGAKIRLYYAIVASIREFYRWVCGPLALCVDDSFE